MVISEIIKYEGDNSTLVWKHPIEDFNTSTQLIVHESQEAVFFRNGQALDLFGPGKHTLETENIPFLKQLINLPTGGVTPFHCEVYFVNKAIPLNLKWGTSSPFEVMDPKFQVLLNVGASGALGIQINDARKFLLKLIGTGRELNTNELTAYFKEAITTYVKTYLSKIMSEVSFVIINQYIEDISNALKSRISLDMAEYGVNLVNFYLSTVHIPDEDKQRVKSVLNQKMEYTTLEYNWVDEQLADIAKKYASNEGSQSNVGGMMAQMPVAFAFGQMLRNNTKPLMDSVFTNEPKGFGGALKPKAEPPISQNGSCPKCQSKIGENSKFCSSCGYQIIGSDKCKCGRMLKSSDRFCPDCGTQREG